MKKFFAIFLISLLTVCSCDIIFPDNPDNPDNPGGNDKPGKNGITTSVQELKFPAGGGEQSFTVTTNVKDWGAGACENWHKCSTSGNTVTVTVEPNRTFVERKGTVSIGNGDGKNCEVAIIQEAKSGTPGGSDASGTVDGYNPYPNADFIVNDNVMFMRDSVAQKIKSVDTKTTTFVLSKDASPEFIPQVGEHYIVNNRLDLFPNGVLMMIQNVKETADGYEIYYSTDGLGAAFKTLHIEEQDVSLSSYVKSVTDGNGKEIPFKITRATESDKWHIEMPQVGWDIGAGFSFTPKMAVDVNLKIQLLMDDWRISTFNVVADTDVTIGADISIGVEGQILDYHKKLASIICGAIPVGPILVTPTIDIYAVFTASGGISFEGSVSYKDGSVTKFHYDEINGVSGDLSAKNNGKFEYSVGPKIAGSMSYGLAIGPAVGIYGDIVSVGISIETLMDEEVSHKTNIADPKTWNHTSIWSWGKALQEGEYATSFLLGGSVHLTGLGFPVTQTLKTIKFPIETVKLIPTLSEVCQVEVHGRELTFNTWVKNKALVYPEMILTYGDGLSVPLNFGAGEIAELENGADSVMVTNVITIDDNNRHNFNITGSYLDMEVGMMQYNTYVTAVDEDEEYAMKEILADIYACRGGDWKGCDWSDSKIGVANMANVKLSKDSGNGFNCYRILVPPEWKLSDNLTVSNHSAKVKNFEWELDCEGDRTFSRVDIEDACCFSAFVGDDCDTYIFHSKLEKLNTSIPDHVKTLDLAGTNVEDFRVDPFLNKEFKPKKVILDDCKKLKSITLGRSDSKFLEMAPVVSAKNCPNLKTVGVSNTAVPDGVLKDIDMVGGMLYFEKVTGLKDLNIVMKCESLSIYSCSFNTLAVAGLQNLKDIKVWTCTFQSASISGLPAVEKISFIRNTIQSIAISDCAVLENVEVYNYSEEGYKIDALSVTNCASLKSLYCPGIGMSSFEASGLPVIESLNCKDNKNLTGVVLPVFDQMYNAGYKPYYDIRYEYEWERLKKDNGYGYYYIGEPDRGYHHYD